MNAAKVCHPDGKLFHPSALLRQHPHPAIQKRQANRQRSVPLPSLLSIASSPPCSRTIRRTMSETEPRTARLGREIGLENAAQVFRRESAAGIGKADLDVRVVAIGPDAQNAAAFHRLETVLNHVVEGLFHLIAIELEQRQIGAQLSLDHDVAVLISGWKKRTASCTISLTSSGCSCGLDGRMARRNWVTMESSRLISERAMSIDSCSSRLSSADRELFALSLHQLKMDMERIERIADFVGHPGGEQREGRETFGLDRLLGRAAALP